jgi:hypothetical protein
VRRAARTGGRSGHRLPYCGDCGQCVVDDVGAGFLREPADGRFGESDDVLRVRAVDGPTKVMAGGITDSTVRRMSGSGWGVAEAVGTAEPDEGAAQQRP